jgi:Arc/MetJ family transcription regulator
MRTNIVIDDDLMREAKAAAGTTTMRETVEQALRELVDRQKRLAILDLRGRYRWEGDLDEMRADRF